MSQGVIHTVQPLIKFARATIPSVTIGSGGYTDIGSYRPEGHTIINTIIVTWSQNSKQDAFGVNKFGNYVFGTAGATITNLQLEYWYTD